MKNSISIFFYSLVLLPYFILLYRRVNIRIRLLIVSLIEIVIFYTIFLILNEDSPLIPYVFSYEIIVFVSILINLLFMCLFWISHRWSKNDKKF